MRIAFCREMVHAVFVCAAFAASAPLFAQSFDDSMSSDARSNCRAIAGQAEIDGTMQQIVGRACLQSDGTWRIVQSDDGSVLTYPIADYPYVDPWYVGPPVFIGVGVGFIFVDRFHHFHRYNRFNQMNHYHVRGGYAGGFHGGGHMYAHGGMGRR
jgi:surface antigen